MNFACQADEYNNHMYCGRCNLTWSKADEAKITCKPKADPPIGLGEMAIDVLRAARKIVDGQHAAVKAGLRVDPYMPALREAAVLVAAHAVLERLRTDKRIVELLKEGNG